jgi:hypothetical protein
MKAIVCKTFSKVLSAVFGEAIMNKEQLMVDDVKVIDLIIKYNLNKN